MSSFDLIKSSPLFHELYDAEIERVLQNCSVVTFKEGETLIQEGEEGDELFLILAGGADVLKSSGADLKILARLKRGDIFGEMVLINEIKRTSTVIATGECVVLVVHRDRIFSLFEKETKIFAILAFNLARLLTRRLKQAAQQIVGEAA